MLRLSTSFNQYSFLLFQCQLIPQLTMDSICVGVQKLTVLQQLKVTQLQQIQEELKWLDDEYWSPCEVVALVRFKVN